MTLEEKITAVESFYLELEKDLLEFQTQSGLSCITGCSACCRKPNIEASVLEFLPLAFHLYKENKAELFYDALLQNNSSFCALYNPMNLKGACTSYAHRALICRLFGYSFTRGKEGIPVMITCKELKLQEQGKYEMIMKEAAEGKEVPFVGYYYNRLISIDPYLAEHIYPANEAMRKALEIVLNNFHYRESLSNENRNVS